MAGKGTYGTSPKNRKGQAMPYINVYLQPEQIELLDQWVTELNDPVASRSTIIRDLIRERAAKK